MVGATYTNTRSLVVKSRDHDLDTRAVITDMERYGFLSMFGGVQDILNNRFQLIFVSEEEKEKAKRIWPEVDDGNYRLEIHAEKRSLTLMGIPMEYPDHFLEEYMKRYVTDPRSEHLTHDGTNISNDCDVSRTRALEDR